jgi:hypothetical protein
MCELCGMHVMKKNRIKYVFWREEPEATVKDVERTYYFTRLFFFFFFFFLKKPTFQKTYFVGPGERVKFWLSQALTRGARPDSNSRPAVQISNPLPSRYALWGYFIKTPNIYIKKSCFFKIAWLILLKIQVDFVKI